MRLAHINDGCLVLSSQKFVKSYHLLLAVPRDVRYAYEMKTLDFQQAFLDQIGDPRLIQHLFEALPDVAFFIKDTKGRFVMQNRRSQDYSGVESERDVIGKTDHDLFSKDRADIYAASDQAVIKSGKPILNTVEPAPEHSDRLIVGSKFPIRGKNNKTIGVAGVHRIIDGMRDTPEWYGRIAQVLDYMHKTYATPITLADLVKRSRISQAHFERRFSKILGCSPIEYLLRVRIRAARDLLEHTDRTITDIALAVGFYDHSHFTKTFKQQISCTPFTYRKRHQREA
jgi:AraC-like DNA-binding protein